MYLYTKYFQKSRAFLYPLVGNKKKELFTPKNTYLYWDGKESIENGYLIVYYEHNFDVAYNMFEEEKIMKNKLISNCYILDSGTVYIYDLNIYEDTIQKFLNGKYSKFKPVIKDRIFSYHGINKTFNTPRNDDPVSCALNPSIYYDVVADELGYEDSTYLRQEVGELCSKFDVEKETLVADVISQCKQPNLII